MQFSSNKTLYSPIIEYINLWFTFHKIDSQIDMIKWHIFIHFLSVHHRKFHYYYNKFYTLFLQFHFLIEQWKPYCVTLLSSKTFCLSETWRYEVVITSNINLCLCCLRIAKNQAFKWLHKIYGNLSQFMKEK